MRAQAERDDGVPDVPMPSDARQPFDLPLAHLGYRDLRIEPRSGYVSWRAVDADTGERLSRISARPHLVPSVLGSKMQRTIRDDISPWHLREYVTTSDASTRCSISYTFNLSNGEQLSSVCIHMLAEALPGLDPHAANQVMKQLAVVLPDDWADQSDKYRKLAFHSDLLALRDRYRITDAEMADHLTPVLSHKR